MSLGNRVGHVVEFKYVRFNQREVSIDCGRKDKKKNVVRYDKVLLKIRKTLRNLYIKIE